ncbi:MAG TPA: hypothetical protein VKU19_14995 [Bryobacteraceae bacterium]|nr:hypothetical protein [Bryobacteraceae bacterium]
MRKLLSIFVFSTCLLCAQDSLLFQPRTPAPKLWRASITALAAANIVDVHSSWGKHELNSTLSSPSGNFGKEGALIKLGFQGGLIGFEYLITRGHRSRKLYRALTIVNFSVSGAIGGVAIHNYTVPRPQ